MSCVLHDDRGPGPRPADTATIAECQRMEPADLADHIIAEHHDRLCCELPFLTDLLAEALAERGAPQPWIWDLAPIFEGYARLTREHMTGFEQITLPLLRELRCAERRPGCYPGGLDRCAREIDQYHAAVKGVLASFRRLTRNYAVPHGAGPSLTTLLKGLRELEFEHHLHAVKESQVLMPRAVEAEKRLSQSPRRVAGRPLKPEFHDTPM